MTEAQPGEGLEHWIARREAPMVAIILLIGYIARLLWLFLEPQERLRPHQSEMWHVTMHWVQTGVLADAYGAGSGISSHVGPVNVVIAGTIYRMAGVETIAAEFMLSMIAGLYAVALFYFLYKLSGELGIARVPRIAALIVVSLVPLNFYTEAVDFRIREGLLAAALAAGLLWWLLLLDRRGAPRRRDLFLFGLVSALAFLVNPVVALGSYAGLGFVILRHVRWQAWPATALVLLVGFLLVNGPWIVRNFEVYDRFMPSRGNFGLELATANHPSAVDPVDPRLAFHTRMKEIHPFFSDEAFAKFKQYPSDVAYFDHLGAEARAWIAANPGDFATVTARHVREHWLPSLWMYNLYDERPPTMSNRIRQIWHWTLGLLSLLAIGYGLLKMPRQYLFVVLSILPVIILYSLVQPTIRYRYLLLGLMTFLAFGAAWRLLLVPMVSVVDRQRT